jgi:Histidine kinase-, DNA gyrase B-, and HSP90-like ATPase
MTMSDTNQTSDRAPESQANGLPLTDGEFTPQWASTSPRGGRTVLNRVLKDGQKVPLFLGQTLVNSLRDLGYNSTTSALCELVDNAIQWGAGEVRIYFHQTGKKGGQRIDILVFDDGQGMAPNVLKVAASFGGSMVFDSRTGIGRYGMGMKSASLHLCPVLDIYSWQEPGAYYNLTLDVEEIGNSRSNLIEMADPTLCDQLPSEVVDILTRAMSFPKNPQETQTLFAEDREELREKLGKSGTIIYLPECDRLSFRTAQTLAEHAIKEMGRVYRRFIDRGLKLYVNNRLVEAFDPTYWMKSARHTRVEGLMETRSRLVGSWPIDIPVSEGSDQTSRITAKLYALPYEAWSGLPRKMLKNDLHVYDDHTVSFMRNDRELEIGTEPKLKLKKHHTNNWIRLEVDFSGEADEGFTVASNKQGVRLKEYVARAILDKIGDEVISLKKAITELKAKRAALKGTSKVSEAERRATDAEALQGKQLPEIPAEQQAALEQNLRVLAGELKRDDETDEQALERVKSSTYLITTKHDEYRPFYTCDHKYGRIILTLNSAHRFFQRVWQPLNDLARTADISQEGNEDADEVTSGVSATANEVLVAIQLMLLSLARTQSQLSGHDSQSEHRYLFTKLQREWSENYQTQLLAH